MNEQQSQIMVHKSSGGKTLEKYKKRLLIQVIVIFAICLVIILERIFYQVIIEQEELIISHLQSTSGLIEQNNQGKFIPKNITEPALEFFAYLSEFHVQFLLLTHVLATLFVSFDAIVTSKILYVSMAIIYLISVIQMFYGGARPFWRTESIMSSSCLQSYNHPSLGLILLLFTPSYTYYCWKVRSGKKMFIFPLKKSTLLLAILSLMLIFAIQFLNYFVGTSFLINIAMSLVFFVLIWMIAISLNAIIEKAIKKSTVMKLDAKKYVFYWLLVICLLETFVLIVYSGEDVFLDIDWVKNYMSCVSYLDLDKKSYRYDEVIGPWFNFIQTASVFAWIGAIFGISASFRKIDSIEWYAGSAKKRFLRAAITNLCIIPSWIFILLIEKQGNWIKDIGLNEFIVDAVHYFILYIWIFGYMPIYVFHKLLKLTNKETEDFYVILEEKK